MFPKNVTLTLSFVRDKNILKYASIIVLASMLDKMVFSEKIFQRKTNIMDKHD